MTAALRTPRMTRDAFLYWAEVQRERCEFDGFAPVAMTGGEVLSMPESGVGIPAAEFREGTDLPGTVSGEG